MKNKLFFILTNKLHEMKFHKYIDYLRNYIFKKPWFKQACKEKKIRIEYLSRNLFFNKADKLPVKIINNKLYFYKLVAIKFIYEKLENNNHLKLLNINIKNEVLLNTTSHLIDIQKKFIETNYYQDLHLFNRNFFIKSYIKKFNSYLDASILSKVLNNTQYYLNGKKFKLANLISNKTYIYSLYIKEIITKNSNIHSDESIAKILYKKYKIEISRRNVCYIRNKYLIPKSTNKNLFNFYNFHQKLFNEKKKLTKNTINNLKKNIKGIYELSSKNEEKYPFSKNDILYIGSSRNIKKRLSSYTTKNAHSSKIKEYLKNNEIYFRIIPTTFYKQYEMFFLNAFMKMSGILPILNKQRVLNISQITQ